MARVFIEGFESGDLSLWDGVANPSNAYIQTPPPGFGSGNYCYYSTFATTGGIQKFLPSSPVYFMAVTYRSSNTGITALFSFNGGRGSTTLLKIGKDSTTQFLKATTAGGTLLGTGTQACNVGQSRLIEVYYVPHLTNGQLIVKVDGYTDISVSGAKTSDSTMNIDTLCLGDYANSTGGGYYDNLVIDNSEWIGQTFIAPLIVSGAGSSTQWTPSTGLNYQCVDEVPPSDTDFVSTITPSALDLYLTSGITTTVGVIKAVQIQGRCWKEGILTDKTISLALKSGLTTSLSPAITIGFAATPLKTYLWQSNPSTGNAFTQSEINSLQFGIELL